MYAARWMASVAGQNWSTETAVVISAGMIITHCKRSVESPWHLRWDVWGLYSKPEINANREPKRRVDEFGALAYESAVDGEIGGHLANGAVLCVDDYPVAELSVLPPLTMFMLDCKQT
jgi:hypothetical protein